MKPEVHALHQAEMAFFREAQEIYNATLDECGDIGRSLSLLKKEQDHRKRKVSAAKRARLNAALRSGEIIRGKRSTPGDWAAQEVKLAKSALRAALAR